MSRRSRIEVWALLAPAMVFVTFTALAFLVAPIPASSSKASFI